MDYKGIKEYLKQDLEGVNALMCKSLSSDIALLDKTNKSVLAHSGKQIRPVLCLLAARACSGGFVTEDTLLYASAVELLHNATLLHDDVADDSPMRRGVPTVMSLLGGRASVLLGDYWLVKGMENILASANSSAKVIRIFAATLSDLAEGELLQLQKADTGDTLEQDYYKIIYNKTSSLFVAAATSGAMSVGASEEKMKAVRTYAKCLGQAFQIKDDILDYAGSGELGKPVGMDLKEQKITLPLIGALSTLEDESPVRDKILHIHEHPEYCGQLHSFVIERGGIEYAAARLQEYIDKAVDALRPVPDSPARDALVEIARFNAFRQV